MRDLLLTPELTPDFSPEQARLLESLAPLYREWNSRINVISRKDIDNVFEHHVMHSLAIARYLSLNGLSLDGKKVLDLGTGGGFPGIPLAIAYPGASFVLCDSVGKKTIVASAVADALGLSNVRVVNARAESLQENFDFVVSRAVAQLSDLLPWVKGRWTSGVLCLKGGEINGEIAAARIPFDKVHTWRVDSWIADPYYEGKFVVHIEK